MIRWMLAGICYGASIALIRSALKAAEQLGYERGVAMGANGVLTVVAAVRAGAEKATAGRDTTDAAFVCDDCCETAGEATE